MKENIFKPKYNALQDIYSSFMNYHGSKPSRLETNLKALETKLDKFEYDELMHSFAIYTDYILVILARSYRVRVKLDNFTNEFSAIEPNTIFNEEILQS